jgi:NAD-dependent DNA ligase
MIIISRIANSRQKPKAQKAKGKAKANTKAKADPAPKAKAVSAPKAKAVSAPKAKASAASSDSSIAGKKVIITGTISGYDRKGADAVLEDAGAEICKSLNKQVEVVIIGTNAGPTKMAKIEEMGLETISWNDLVEELGLEAAPEKKVANVDAGDAPDSIDGMTVLVTGTIEGHTRGDAQKMLESAGAKVAKSLNKQVELAILGSKPGPDKLNKIAEEGIPTCSFVDLVEKLGLEAEASEPPKKKSKKN